MRLLPLVDSTSSDTLWQGVASLGRTLARHHPRAAGVCGWACTNSSGSLLALGRRELDLHEHGDDAVGNGHFRVGREECLRRGRAGGAVLQRPGSGGREALETSSWIRGVWASTTGIDDPRSASGPAEPGGRDQFVRLRLVLHRNSEQLWQQGALTSDISFGLAAVSSVFGLDDLFCLHGDFVRGRR